MDIKFLQPEEQKTLSELSDNVFEIKSRLGEIEESKFVMMASLFDAKDKLQLFKNELTKKYGNNISVDMKTGEIKQNLQKT
ncbi:MAG: hypothetical protein [Podoviridae sp. ctrTa16]|nr:MAG: hypothetical protein [Podoviridae sp. ctrTa16]